MTQGTKGSVDQDPRSPLPNLGSPLPEGFPEHFEIVTGARRFRAAQLAALDSVPVRIVSLSDTRERPENHGLKSWVQETVSSATIS
jgi:ParB-like nuclease domain